MITGPAPKPDDERQRRNIQRFDKTVIVPDGIKRGPDLRDIIIPGITWCEHTLMWFDLWRVSPQSKVMTETDWETMKEAAFMHNMIFSGTDLGGKKLSPNAIVQLMDQLKRRVSAFGATFEDRLKLRMVIDTDQTEEEQEAEIKAGSEKIVSYLEMMNTFVAEKTKEE